MRSQLPRPLEILRDDQIHALHQSILQVLAEIGVRIEWKPALEVFASHGCPVDFEARLVKIPQTVLDRALQRCPNEFTLHALNPQNDMQVTLEDIYTIARSSALNVLDLDGQRRSATRKDLEDFLTVVLVYFFSRELSGPGAAWPSAFVMATTFFFLKYARHAKIDVTLTFFSALALYAAVLALRKDARWFLLWGASSAFCVLMKSVLGFFPPLITVVFLLATRRGRTLLDPWFLAGSAVAIVAGCSWYIHEPRVRVRLHEASFQLAHRPARLRGRRRSVAFAPVVPRRHRRHLLAVAAGVRLGRVAAR